MKLKQIILSLACLLIFTGVVSAQNRFQYVRRIAGVPTTCASRAIYINTLTGDLYALKDGTGCVLAGNTAAKQPLDSDLTTIAGLTATTDNFIQSKSSAWASRTIAQVKTDFALPYDVALNYTGVPAASSTIRVVVPRSFNSATNWVGTLCSAGTAATAQTDFLLKVNGVTKLTLRFAAAGTTCSLVSPTSVSFVAGDVITITSPGTPDATLADVAISLLGTLP